MDDVVIRAEALGKEYRIGRQRPERYTALRDVIADTARRLFRSRQRWEGESPAVEDFWALRDVSFEVRRGEALGIIGRNGAGKSTLLKILSRITQPTEGRVELDGRVASLLEVGTGFHPELTGRENIYLNGSILGMTRPEIKGRFDEIVAFAEVDKFLDTPVKRYSSGMYVRLAFAVAAHLEPDILIVDEVLAVGDAAFQKKCLGSMGAVASQGRTVLFVSHNMGAVSRLCQRCIWLDQGRVRKEGPTNAVVASYLSEHERAGGERSWAGEARLPGTPSGRLRAVRLLDTESQVRAVFDIQRPIYIELEYELLRTLSVFRSAVRVIAGDGTIVFTSADSADTRWQGRPRGPGLFVSRCTIPADFLNAGGYAVTVSADVPFVEVVFMEEAVLNFRVEQTGGVSGEYPEGWPGVVCPRLHWQIKQLA
jgi:lipopolysaccharide transport system ATP-binding protein